MGKPNASAVWEKLKAERNGFETRTLSDLFLADKSRAENFAIKLDGLTLDYSRNHFTNETLSLLIGLAKDQKLPEWRSKMYGGEKINNSEDRAVLHTVLRTQKDDPVFVDGVDVVPLVRAAQRKMAAFVADVRGGEWLGATGEAITHVVNIGIGGSDLGPRLAVSALRNYADGPEVRFVANVDAAELVGVLKDLDPATTLFVVASKTFTTQETMLNAQAARRWLTSVLGDAAVARHFVAVSSNQDNVVNFGIASSNIFPMWDWVGGRYSLWSAVGLCIALSIGWNNFESMLSGAAAMDDHFISTPPNRNMPVLSALIGVWYRNFWGAHGRAVMPYDERLRDLPRYLQQLEMESNGKSVTRDGEAIEYQTAPITFGECGSVSQHSFHQWLHQGTDRIPSDFIGVIRDDWGLPEQHKALILNLKAQADALTYGYVDNKSPQLTNPGDRPCSILWLDGLDPYNFGLLLAFYEHRTFTQGVIWGINPFDQWGVQLGKKLAAKMEM
ncbi:MAG: glucose-6-phosphate isomerase [Alphaproteobacteria bacterium]|nr:glucose-6-phosphate isomerase [Alphaproteobacteria bacterium]